MAVTVIQNNFVAGALAGIKAGKQGSSFTPTDYANDANVARAIADECIVRNAALGAPMADADNAQIGQVCYASAFAATFGWFSNTVTVADYLAIANYIVAQAKQTASKLI